MEHSVFFSFFGGVSQDASSWMIDYDKVLFELARWLLPIGVCLLAQGVCFENQRKIEPLLCYRYGTIKIWWRQKFVKSLLIGVSVASALFFTAIAFDIMGTAGFSGEVWRVLVLWLAHIVTTMSLFLVLVLTKLRRLAPAILLLLEGCTFLAGFKYIGAARFMYGMWGMYFQSKWYYGETGVPVLISLTADSILLVLSYFVGRVILGRTAQNEWI